MKGNGLKASRMVKAFFTTSMEINTTEIGNTTNAMDMEFIPIKRELYIQVIGVTILKKVTEKKYGQLVPNISDLTVTE